MAVSNCGELYAWGLSSEGRLGLSTSKYNIRIPSKVPFSGKVIDVECGFIHSVIVSLDGTISLCGGRKKRDDEDEVNSGHPVQLPNFNIWHRTLKVHPSDHFKSKKSNNKCVYEVKRRSRMMEEVE